MLTLSSLWIYVSITYVSKSERIFDNKKGLCDFHFYWFHFEWWKSSEAFFSFVVKQRTTKKNLNWVYYIHTHTYIYHPLINSSLNFMKAEPLILIARQFFSHLWSLCEFHIATKAFNMLSLSLRHRHTFQIWFIFLLLFLTSFFCCCWLATF